MANHFFQFKQFTVYQDACAMKVCTDACIQGAFTATAVAPSLTVLDIGAGTGLLSLMLAQAWPAAQITAVELDAAAAAQATQNFAASPWATRLQVLQGDVRTLSLSQTYDFIISNPPFYEADLKSTNQLRNQAMHATTLDYAALLAVMDRLLTPAGSFSVLLPYAPFAGFVTQAAAAGFYPLHILQVQQSVKHGPFRSIGIFSRKSVEPLTAGMAIRDDENVYTPDFIKLLQPYYLHL